MTDRHRKETCALNRREVLCAFSLIFLLSLVSNITHNVSANVPTVYYKDNGTNVTIYHPNLEINIVKTRENYRAAGRVSSIRYKGGPNFVADDSYIGYIGVYNLSNATAKNKSPVDMVIESAVGNDTCKLVLTLKATSIVDYDTGANAMAATVRVKFTLYSDFDAYFVRVTVDSAIADWLAQDMIYQQGFAFEPFSSYSALGVSYIGSALNGILTQSYRYKINTNQIYNIITVKRSSDSLAVTLLPTTWNNLVGTLLDYPTETRIWLTTYRPTTYDGSIFSYGSHMKNLQYGAAWLFHNASVDPFVITPWALPNAVPYGIAHSYDEMFVNNEEYNKVSPSVDTPYMSSVFNWKDSNAERRINIIFTLNMKSDYYTLRANGYDKSWTWNGSRPFFNTSSVFKSWLQSLESRRIGFGLHAYHHDSPWRWEFSEVTNQTWIQQTWNRIWADWQTLGLTNSSISFWKPAGFRARPQIFEVLPSYPVRLYQWGYVCPAASTPLSVYKHSDGAQIAISYATQAIPDDLESGIPQAVAYNHLRSNLTNYGFVMGTGHVAYIYSQYNKFNGVFASIEADFGEDLEYFLIEEINDYWQDVLLPLEYTYNSTIIEKTSSDSRLTFKLLHEPYSITTGLVYEGTSFDLYAPNFNTGGFKFTHFSGYATLSDFSETYSRVSFKVSAPFNTTSTTKIYVRDMGNATRVLVRNGFCSWQYDVVAKALTLNVLHSGIAEVLIDWLPLGDVNGDRRVDVSDLFALGKAYGSNSTEPNWKSECDLDWNSRVDASDLLAQAENYGKLAYSS